MRFGVFGVKSQENRPMCQRLLTTLKPEARGSPRQSFRATILYIHVEFVWNEGKNRINQRKHHVSSRTALRVFIDPRAVSYLDPVVDDEERWHTIGLAGGVTLLLVD